VVAAKMTICNVTVDCFGVTDKTGQEPAADLCESTSGHRNDITLGLITCCSSFVLRLIVVVKMWLTVVIDDNPLHPVVHPFEFVLLVVVHPLREWVDN
jgi:hypothetical protein